MRPGLRSFVTLTAIAALPACTPPVPRVVQEPWLLATLHPRSKHSEPAAPPKEIPSSPRWLHLARDFKNISRVALSPDAKLVAVADQVPSEKCFQYFGIEASVHENPGFGETAHFTAYNAHAREMAFSLSGDTLAILMTEEDGRQTFTFPVKLVLLDAHSSHATTIDLGVTQHPQALQMSVGLSAVAVALPNKGVVVHQISGGERIVEIADPTIRTMGLSSHDNRLATTDSNGHVQVWALPEGKPLADLGNLPGPATNLSFRGDDLVWALDDGHVGKLVGKRILRLGQLRPDAMFVGLGARDQIVDIAFAHAHSVLWDSTKSYEMTQGGWRGQFPFQPAVSPEGNWFVTASSRRVLLERIGSKGPGMTFGHVDDAAKAVGVSSLKDDVMLIGAVWEDGTTRLWNVMNGQTISPPEGAWPLLSSLAVHGNGLMIAITKDGKPLVYERDGVTLQPRPLSGVGKMITTAEFDMLGKRILLGTKGGDFMVVDSATRKTIRVLHLNAAPILGIGVDTDREVHVEAASEHRFVVDLELGVVHRDDTGYFNWNESYRSISRRGLQTECHGTTCEILRQSPSNRDSWGPIANFGAFDRPGAAYLRVEGRNVDTLGTGSESYFACHEKTQIFPPAHCAEFFEPRGLFGRALTDIEKR